MNTNREGQRVPDVVFRTRRDGQWQDVHSRDLFAGRKVVLFALPGAFTPTCSASHLPRYEELAPTFRKAGVDEVVCLSVNDGFVMEAWGQDQGVRNVRLLPDGNGEFTRGMGMLVGKDDLGFGERSWRYSMLVDDGVITRMFVEPEVEGDPYGVSDADTMLACVAPELAARPPVVVFTKEGCPHCARAKKALGEAALPFQEVDIARIGGLETLRAVSSALTVPQVFVDGVRIGGADDLEAYLASGTSPAASGRAA